MKTLRQAPLLLAAIVLTTAPWMARSQTIAYYRFEEGTPGMRVPVTTDAVAPGGSPVLDYSGNGNHMKTFADFSAPTYSANVPAPVVPLTGAANLLSLGVVPNQDVYSQNAVGGGPNGDTLNDHAFPMFTIEASVQFNDIGGFQTFVGRDRPGETLGGFYLRKWGSVGPGDPNANTFNVTVVADDNTTFDLWSTGTGAGDTFSMVEAGVWYNVVAQSDGAMLSLFVQNPVTREYELQGSIPITTGLSNTNATNFTIGRGWFNGPADFVNGFIDEVRISDVALAPLQFLFAVPEPGSIALLASLLGAGILYRRRRPASRRTKTL